MKMKKFILSIIVFLCVYPVANANNGNFKIKFLSESEKSSIRPTQSAFIVTQKSLRGLGVEVYLNVRQTSSQVFNQEKSSKEIRLEKRLKTLETYFKNNPAKSREKQVEEFEMLQQLRNSLKKEREKRRQRAENESRGMGRTKNVGLILEASNLGGHLTNSSTSDITKVSKRAFEIGVRIDW